MKGSMPDASHIRSVFEKRAALSSNSSKVDQSQLRPLLMATGIYATEDQCREWCGSMGLSNSISCAQFMQLVNSKWSAYHSTHSTRRGHLISDAKTGWAEQVDANTGCVLYANWRTGQRQWEKPDAFRSNDNDHTSFDQSRQAEVARTRDRLDHITKARIRLFLGQGYKVEDMDCLLYTSPSPRDS